MRVNDINRSSHHPVKATNYTIVLPFFQLDFCNDISSPSSWGVYNVFEFGEDNLEL